MSSSYARSRLSAAVVAGPIAAAVLVAGTAAHAASPVALVSLAQAKAALPAAEAMPGHPRTVTVTTEPLLGKLQPCLQPHPKTIALHGAHSVTAVYFITPAGKANPAGQVALTSFTITAVVFHTAAAAATALAAVDAAERHCPAHISAPDGSVTRTLSQRYTVHAWTGWRSIAHLDFPADPTVPGDTATSIRLNQEFLVRGNVLLNLTETGGTPTGSGPVQDKARKAATTAMLAGYAKR